MSKEESPEKSKKKEDDWGWGSVLGGIAVAGTLAVGAGLAYKAYSDKQEKECLEKEQEQTVVQHFQRGHQAHSSDDDDSPPPSYNAVQEQDAEKIGRGVESVEILEQIHQYLVSVDSKQEKYVNYFLQVKKYLVQKLCEESQALTLLINDKTASGNILLTFISIYTF